MAAFVPRTVYLLALVCGSYIRTTQTELTALAVNKGVKYYPTADDLKYVKDNAACNPTSVVSRQFISMIADSPVFIDKTLLIKEILATPNHTMLITLPKKWGKSIALDMLRLFLSIEVDDNGTRIEPSTETRAYKLFKHGYINENKSLEKPLLISHHDDVFAKHQGQYPVITIDLFFFGFPNLLMFHTLLQLKVSFAYRRHAYMLDIFGTIKNSTTANAEDKAYAEKAYNKFRYYLTDDIGRDDLIVGIKYLSELLHKHYKRKIFLLLDEYDDVINYMLTEYKSNDKGKVREFYLKFLKTSLHDNPYIEKCVITGIAGIARSIPEAGLSSVVHYSIFDTPFARYIGYTHREMQLVHDFIKIPADRRENITKWYNGHKINLETTLQMYGSECVNHYMKVKEFEVCWEAKPGVLQQVLPKFMTLPNFEEVFCLLTSGSYIPLQLESFNFTLENWNYIEHVAAGGEPDNEYALKKGTNPLQEALHFLLISGYLTWHHYKPILKSNRTYITVQVPNEDIATTFKAESLAYYVNYLNITRLKLIKHTRKINRLFKDFLYDDHANSSAELVTAIEQFLGDLPRFTDDEFNRTGYRPTSTQIPTTHAHITDSRSLQRIRSALRYVFSASGTFRLHYTKYAEDWNVDILLTHGKRGLLLMVNKVFNSTFQIIFRYNDYFKDIEVCKLTGIGVKLDKSLFLIGYQYDLKKNDRLS